MFYAKCAFHYKYEYIPLPSCAEAECFGLVRSSASSSRLLLFQYRSDALFVLLIDFSDSLLPDLELDLLSRPLKKEVTFRFCLKS